MDNSRIRILGRRILDFFFARHCIGCGMPLLNGSGYRYICHRCLGEIDWIRHYFCPRCSAPDIENPQKEGCSNCKKLNFSFKCNRSLYVYAGVGRKMIHELKYRNGHYLLPDIGRLSGEISMQLDDALLVPVPLHWRRLWARGFNQSELICRHLTKFHRCKICHLLRRSKHTSQQVGLCIAKRRENVDGAFKINHRLLKKNNLAKNQKIVLVDDVFTTGSTLQACASELVDHGFSNIETFTLARA
ncbi:MAG: ComF family protein [Puniceicoccales bacterium]|nr:ComF family protein [Puniceicoccales bacterium]